MKSVEINLDALREICAIGAGHASTALAEMTNAKINVSFPTAGFYKIEDVPSLIGKPEMAVATVYLKMNGTLDGNEVPLGGFLLIFSENDALEFANLLQNKKAKELGDIEKDALKETGNILSGASLNAMSTMLDFRLIEFLPDIAVDMLNATLDEMLAEIAQSEENALVFKTTFSFEPYAIRNSLVLIFNPNVYELLINKIEKMQIIGKWKE